MDKGIIGPINPKLQVPEIEPLRRPGIEKKDSKIKLPIKSDGMITTTPVIIGINAFGKTCENNTRISDNPFARAVRT